MSGELFVGKSQSPAVAVAGVVVAAVAIVGTQVFGWEWGSGQLVPTIIGVAVATFAIVAVAAERLRLFE